MSWNLKKEARDLIDKGVEAWNAWRRENTFLLPYLVGVDLSRRDLRGFDFSNAEMGGTLLVETDLSGANLYQAELYKATLHRASLKRCNMRGAKLHLSDLTEADLAEADLYRADFIESKLSGTNFDGARCDTTTFSRVDLSVALNLDRLVHTGPSNIDVLTFRTMSGPLPVSFLRAAGLPPILTEYLPALVGEAAPIQYYSCFISYSHLDEEFARLLFCRLRAAGLQVWFAPEALKRGRKIHEQIDEAIYLHDKLLVVLSQHSLKSNWVATELRKALRREAIESRRMFFPISLVCFEELRRWECFDADSGRDIATEIRGYFIPDFSNWRNQAHFEEAAQALIRDLRP